MANIGYARVSSREQHLDMQLTALMEKGCDIIFQEKVTSIPGDKPISKGSSKERICTSVDKNVMNKIRTISETEGIQINELITLGLDMVISKYEETHGEVRPKKINKGNIDNIFR